MDLDSRPLDIWRLGVRIIQWLSSRFTLESDFRRWLIWRKQRTRHIPSNVVGRDQYGGDEVMLCISIYSTGRTTICEITMINGQGLNATRYHHETLAVYMREFWRHVGENFPLMDNNSGPHTVSLVDKFLESKNNNLLDCRRFYRN